jgi:hypothetical protein
VRLTDALIFTAVCGLAAGMIKLTPDALTLQRAVTPDWPGHGSGNPCR